MTLAAYPIPSFGGLDLRSDPSEVGARGAVDLLNVDLDKQGRVRSRDGYDNLTSSAAASRLDNIAAFYKTSGTKQVIVSSNTGSFYRVYSTAGATVASQTVGVAGTDAIYEADFTRFGGPTAEYAYATSNGGDPLGGAPLNLAYPVYKWSGSAWSTATGCRLGGAGNYPVMLEVKAGENRLVGAFLNDNASRVGFSGPGTPETWAANDYVDLTPGDGERISALVSWREMVFAFKETKFFVFDRTTTLGDGSALFNYRPVSTGVGAVGRACAVATPNGVYFLARRGIYRTTGGDPVLVSRDIDPVFRGGVSNFYAGGVLNHAAIGRCQLAWHDERLYFAYPSGAATSNDRLFVYDPETNVWLLWDVAVNGMASFRVGDSAELAFTYAAGSNHVGRHSSSYTTDDGTAITSHYQSGYYELAPGLEAFTRWTRVWGSGTPTVDVYTDEATSDPMSRGGPVTLGTAPQVEQGYHLKSYQGFTFSHRLSGTSPWVVSKVQHDISSAR